VQQLLRAGKQSPLSNEPSKLSPVPEAARLDGAMAARSRMTSAGLNRDRGSQIRTRRPWKIEDNR
jgi:hypothetical protein